MLQSSDLVETSIFDFSEEARWKPMSSDAIRSVCRKGSMTSWPSLPPLVGPSLDAALVSNDLEHELRSLVYEHRRVGTLRQLLIVFFTQTHGFFVFKDDGLSTTWDEHLSYLLTPALAAYETERVTGKFLCEILFQFVRRLTK